VRLRGLSADTAEELLSNPGLFNDNLEAALLPTWARNVALNIESGFFRGAEGIQRLQSKPEGRPVIVCGSGPSLDPVLPLLAQCGDRETREPIIVGCTSNVSAFVEAEVIPDFVVAVDGGPGIPEHVRGYGAWAQRYQVPLIAAVWLNPNALRRWQGSKYYFITTTTPDSPTRLFAYQLPHMAESVMPAVGCVANCSVFFGSAILGGREIYLAGVDFCFLHERGYCRRYRFDTESQGFQPIPDPGPKLEYMVRRIDGRHGEKWLVDKDMIAYRTVLERMVKDNQNPGPTDRALSVKTFCDQGVLHPDVIPYCNPEEVIKQWACSK